MNKSNLLVVYTVSLLFGASIFGAAAEPANIDSLIRKRCVAENFPIPGRADDAIFLGILSRYPRPDEKETALPLMSQARGRKAVMGALFLTSEFFL